MTYGAFLVLFLGAPLLALIFLTHRHLSRALLLALLLISAIAVLYTGPWDNFIVNNDVWSYAPGKITGIVIGRVPLEEYLFYVLQVFLTGLLTVRLLLRQGGKTTC